MNYQGLEERARDKPSVYIYQKTLNNYGSSKFTLSLQNDYFIFRGIAFFVIEGSSTQLFLVIEIKECLKRREI